MRKSILRYFIVILMTALVFCSLFFYYTTQEIVLNIAKEDMTTLIQVVDHSLTLNQDVSSLKPILNQNQVRITLIDLNGNVLFDSDFNQNQADNHLEREEVQEALTHNYGYSQRYSSSLKMTMYYIAYYNSDLEMIERLSIPLSQLREYQRFLAPWLLTGTCILIVVSYLLAKHFSESVSRPLNEIADEMSKLENQDYDLHFKDYSYSELKVITSTTTSLASSIESYLRQLEREKRIRQIFFSNASHELKTPLTSIKGYTELLGNEDLLDEETKKEVIARLGKETENMANLVNDILMISRLETKDVKVEMQVIFVNQFIEETMNHFKPLSKKYGVTLSMRSHGTLYVEMALSHLRSLVDNLLSNAIKYNKPEGKVFLDFYQDGNQLILEVEDTGIGIPKAHQSHVFERFYRIDKGRSKKVGGTGLGLAIVKHIVGYYNGTITLTSEENKGTKITVTLPIIKKT